MVSSSVGRASTSTSAQHTLAERQAKASMEASGGMTMVAGGVGVHGFNAPSYTAVSAPDLTQRALVNSLCRRETPSPEETNFTSPGSAGEAKQNAVVGWLEVETSKVSVSTAFQGPCNNSGKPSMPTPREALTPNASSAATIMSWLRERSEASPSTITGTSNRAQSAIKMRRAVPELPAWSTLTGGRRPCGPTPSIRHETDP